MSTSTSRWGISQPWVSTQDLEQPNLGDLLIIQGSILLGMAYPSARSWAPGEHLHQTCHFYFPSLQTAFCECVFGREHLPKPQPAVDKWAEPPRGAQSSLTSLFPSWELMPIENHREIHEGNELPPHLFLGKPIYPAATSLWDVLGRVAGVK